MCCPLFLVTRASLHTCLGSLLSLVEVLTQHLSMNKVVHISLFFIKFLSFHSSLDFHAYFGHPNHLMLLLFNLLLMCSRWQFFLEYIMIVFGNSLRGRNSFSSLARLNRHQCHSTASSFVFTQSSEVTYSFDPRTQTRVPLKFFQNLLSPIFFCLTLPCSQSRNFLDQIRFEFSFLCIISCLISFPFGIRLSFFLFIWFSSSASLSYF